MKISQREMILGVITLTFVLGGLTWYVINKNLDDHKSKKTIIENLRQQIRLDERRIKMQDEWIAELNNLQKELRIFDIQQKSVAPELMKTINTIAQKHSLSITRNTPRDEKTTDDLYELDISCVWNAELESIVGFLSELQLQDGLCCYPCLFQLHCYK